MITICGSEKRGFKQGKCFGETRFNAIGSCCADPINPGSYYVGDLSSIRYCTPDQVYLVAGSSSEGFADGIGAAARFDSVHGLVCSRDNTVLWVADMFNERIRSVDLNTKLVTTIAGDGEMKSTDGVGLNCSVYFPRRLTFDRSRTVKSESVLFITSGRGLRRFDIASSEMTTCQWKRAGDTGTGTSTSTAGPAPASNLYGIDAVRSGHLIVGCVHTHSVYLYDPNTTEHELLAGGGSVQAQAEPFADGPGQIARFNRMVGLVVVDSERCAFIADAGHNRIRRMTLPAYLFSTAQPALN